MKKYILALTATATLLGACEVDDKYYGKEVVDPAEKLEPAYGEDWTAHADKIDEKLIENFMNTDRGTFWYTDQDRTNESTYCYWPQAHAMDVLIDAYLRIPEGDARRDTYAGYMSKWYENKGNNYGNSYWGTYGFGNAYTDDSEWIILTLIRMYEATGVQKYLAAARKTYEETVIARWTEDENGGGIRPSPPAGRKAGGAAPSAGASTPRTARTPARTVRAPSAPCACGPTAPKEPRGISIWPMRRRFTTGSARRSTIR